MDDILLLGLQLALSGAHMTQNQKLSQLSSTTRDLHGTDLIYTDWSSSKPSHVTSLHHFSLPFWKIFTLMLCVSDFNGSDSIYLQKCILCIDSEIDVE